MVVRGGARCGFEFGDGASMTFSGMQGGATMSGSSGFGTNLNGQQSGGTLTGESISFAGTSDEGAPDGGSGSCTKGREPFADDSMDADEFGDGG